MSNEHRARQKFAPEKEATVGGWSNGMTSGFGPESGGSSPPLPSNYKALPEYYEGWMAHARGWGLYSGHTPAYQAGWRQRAASVGRL